MRTTSAAAVAAMAVTQMCPAPIPAIVVAVGAGAAAVVSGAVAGGISGAISNSKRDLPLAHGAKFRMARQESNLYPPGVNQQEYDHCINEINDQSVPVTFSISANGMVTFRWAT